MPTAIIDDEDLKKFITTETGFQANRIIGKKINEKGEIEVFWRC